MLAKIAASEVPAVSGPPTALQEQLAAAAEYRRHAQWHRLSPLLERLEQRAEEELQRARDSLTAVTAPLAVRAELRGRLDAYKAKVARHGMAEDPLLVERYDAARRMLWSAPCDLRVAEQAVLRYQQAAAEALAPRVPQQGGPSRPDGGACVSRAAVPAARSATGSYEDVGGGELYCDTCGLGPGRRRRTGMVGSPPTGITGARQGLAGGSPVSSRASAARRARVPVLAPVGLRRLSRVAVRSSRPLGLGRGCPARVSRRRRRRAGSVSVRRLGVPRAERLGARAARRRPGRGAGRAAARSARRRCWRTPRCPSASGSAAVATAGRRWAARAASGRAAPRGSAPSAATRTPSCPS